ncbi:hypothetical protein C8R44DRAFT_723526 [Mycena epipterygia]|nr:hypothetical protein C8R44DRAFT_723526 [Mycena epipterygia]
MSNISLAQTLLELVSLIPNNNIRYAMLGLGASITIVCGLRLCPSVHRAHLEESVGRTEEIIREAKSLFPWDRRWRKKSSPRIHVHLAFYPTADTNYGMTAGFKNYRRFRRDIYQCEKEVKRIHITVQVNWSTPIDTVVIMLRFRQLTVEAELQCKFTEAIVTAVQNPLGQAAMYNQSGVAVDFRHNAFETYGLVFH